MSPFFAIHGLIPFLPVKGELKEIAEDFDFDE